MTSSSGILVLRSGTRPRRVSNRADTLFWGAEHCAQDMKLSACCGVTRGLNRASARLRAHPSANARGAFIPTISARGDAVYGYWVGPDTCGARRYGRWGLV